MLLLFILLHSPSYRKPSDDIVCNKTELSHYYRNLTAVHTMKLSRFKSAVKTSGTHIRKHGLILIYISKVCIKTYYWYQIIIIIVTVHYYYHGYTFSDVMLSYNSPPTLFQYLCFCNTFLNPN